MAQAAPAVPPVPPQPTPTGYRCVLPQMVRIPRGSNYVQCDKDTGLPLGVKPRVPKAKATGFTCLPPPKWHSSLQKNIHYVRCNRKTGLPVTVATSSPK